MTHTNYVNKAKRYEGHKTIHTDYINEENTYDSNTGYLVEKLIRLLRIYVSGNSLAITYTSYPNKKLVAIYKD